MMLEGKWNKLQTKILRSFIVYENIFTHEIGNRNKQKKENKEKKLRQEKQELMIPCIALIQHFVISFLRCFS